MCCVDPTRHVVGTGPDLHWRKAEPVARCPAGVVEPHRMDDVAIIDLADTSGRHDSVAPTPDPV